MWSAGGVMNTDSARLRRDFSRAQRGGMGGSGHARQRAQSSLGKACGWESTVREPRWGEGGDASDACNSRL